MGSKIKRIIIGIVILLLIGLVIFYFLGLKSVSNKDKEILFTINAGSSKIDIVNDLKEKGLIRSKYSLYIYVLFNRNLNLQAGVYELNTNMNATDILKKISDGNVKKENNTYQITFIEGKRIPDYAEVIASNTNTTKEEVLNILSDKEYLQELINKYWFLSDDILNEKLYYPLEGYLFASTYEVYNNSTVKDIIAKMLDGTEMVLNTYEQEIKESKYSIHELLTLASIVELESSGTKENKTTSDDAKRMVAGVFLNRLNSGDSLGSDVTTYYGAKKDFTTELYQTEIDDCSNGYNTRGSCNVGKLPIGPICSPSSLAIKAAIEPIKHDYYFFVADKYKNLYFTRNNAEHERMISSLKAEGVWYEY